MLRNIFIALLIGAAINVLDEAHASNLITNGDFETGDFSGWTVSGNGIAIDSVFPNSGNYDAVFGATTQDSNPGTLSQAIATNPGAAYSLNFALLDEAGYSGDSFLVSFGGFTMTITGDQASPPGSLPNSESGYTGFTYNIAGSDITGTTTALVFEGLNDPFTGSDLNLDDVSLSCVANCTPGVTATPAPSAFSLFASILMMGFGFSYARKRKTSSPRVRTWAF